MALPQTRRIKNNMLSRRVKQLHRLDHHIQRNPKLSRRGQCTANPNMPAASQKATSSKKVASQIAQSRLHRWNRRRRWYRRRMRSIVKLSSWWKKVIFRKRSPRTTRSCRTCKNHCKAKSTKRLAASWMSRRHRPRDSSSALCAPRTVWVEIRMASNRRVAHSRWGSESLNRKLLLRWLSCTTKARTTVRDWKWSTRYSVSRKILTISRNLTSRCSKAKPWTWKVITRRQLRYLRITLRSIFRWCRRTKHSLRTMRRARRSATWSSASAGHSFAAKRTLSKVWNVSEKQKWKCLTIRTSRWSWHRYCTRSRANWKRPSSCLARYWK